MMRKIHDTSEEARQKEKVARNRMGWRSGICTGGPISAGQSQETISNGA